MHAFTSSMLSVDEYLKLFHSNVTGKRVKITQSRFNVSAHFLAQCGSEPWTTAITASAPTGTPLIVPQRAMKILLPVRWSSGIAVMYLLAGGGRVIYRGSNTLWAWLWSWLRGEGRLSRGCGIGQCIHE